MDYAEAVAAFFVPRREDRHEEVCGRLNHWGQLCIEVGAFPPDILKRAAG